MSTLPSSPSLPILHIAEGIATITLNRPDAANALDLKMSQDLLAVASRCDSADVRANPELFRLK